MASYGLEARFKDPRDCFRLTDPSAYNHSRYKKVKPNKYGFSSSAPRDTKCWRTPYNDKLYDGRLQHNIPNVTSLKAKTPRFNFKPFTEEDLDEILCRCDKEDPCVCPTVPVVCEAYAHKRLFKGPPPHSVKGAGISIPTKRDRGFEILGDGSARRLLDVVEEECPPFYNTRVTHFPEIYRGWKWSHWLSPRTGKHVDSGPGPADYYIEREKTQEEICMENFRNERRSKSKQLRFIELIQAKNLRDSRVGPADYDPQLPKGTDLKFLGPKEARFPVRKLEIRPSPASYSVKRAFDLPTPPEKPCHAKLPQPSCFGVKAQRFKCRVQEGPTPADYDANVKLCRILSCSKAPFGCSAKRFKEDKIDDDFESDIEEDFEVEEEEITKCPPLTWQFRSKTKRFRSWKKDFDPSIPDVRKSKVERPVRLQALAPFNISQGRFRPWYDWLPIHAGGNTPGPGYYDAIKPRCPPAVNSGPLYRARRFRESYFLTPGPNEHNVDGGVEDVLRTWNKRLRANVEKHSVRFEWIPPPETRHYSYEERELMILNKAIDQLEVEETKPPLDEHKKEGSVLEPESKRVSDDKGESPAITDVGEKRASADESGRRASTDKEEKRASTDKHERRVSADKGEKQPSAEKQDELTKVVVEGQEEKTPKKMLRTFLYKHRMPIYF